MKPTPTGYEVNKNTRVETLTENIAGLNVEVMPVSINFTSTPTNVYDIVESMNRITKIGTSDPDSEDPTYKECNPANVRKNIQKFIVEHKESVITSPDLAGKIDAILENSRSADNPAEVLNKLSPKGYEECAAEALVNAVKLDFNNYAKSLAQSGSSPSNFANSLENMVLESADNVGSVSLPYSMVAQGNTLSNACYNNQTSMLREFIATMCEGFSPPDKRAMLSAVKSVCTSFKDVFSPEDGFYATEAASGGIATSVPGSARAYQSMFTAMKHMVSNISLGLPTSNIAKAIETVSVESLGFRIIRVIDTLTSDDGLPIPLGTFNPEHVLSNMIKKSIEKNPSKMVLPLLVKDKSSDGFQATAFTLDFDNPDDDARYGTVTPYGSTTPERMTGQKIKDAWNSMYIDPNSKYKQPNYLSLVIKDFIVKHPTNPSLTASFPIKNIGGSGDSSGDNYPQDTALSNSDTIVLNGETTSTGVRWLSSNIKFSDNSVHKIDLQYSIALDYTKNKIVVVCLTGNLHQVTAEILPLSGMNNLQPHARTSVQVTPSLYRLEDQIVSLIEYAPEMGKVYNATVGGDSYLSRIKESTSEILILRFEALLYWALENNARRFHQFSDGGGIIEIDFAQKRKERNGVVMMDVPANRYLGFIIGEVLGDVIVKMKKFFSSATHVEKKIVAFTSPTTSTRLGGMKLKDKLGEDNIAGGRLQLGADANGGYSVDLAVFTSMLIADENAKSLDEQMDTVVIYFHLLLSDYLSLSVAIGPTIIQDNSMGFTQLSSGLPFTRQETSFGIHNNTPTTLKLVIKNCSSDKYKNELNVHNDQPIVVSGGTGTGNPGTPNPVVKPPVGGGGTGGSI